MNQIKITGLVFAFMIALGYGYPGESRAASPADNVTYLGFRVGSLDTSVDDPPGDIDLDYLMLQFGIWLSEDISLEARVTGGTSDDSDQGIDFEIESLYGIYGLYHFNISESVSVYGALGASQATIEASTASISDQEFDRGLSYGIGAKFSIFNIEYMRYMDTSEITADTLSLGLQYNID